MGHYEIKDTYNNIIVGSGDTYREAADVLLELSQSINWNKIETLYSPQDKSMQVHHGAVIFNRPFSYQNYISFTIYHADELHPYGILQRV